MYLASFIIIHYIILKCKPEDRINLVYKILFKNVDLKTILGNLLKKCLKNFIKVYQLQIRHLSFITHFSGFAVQIVANCSND